MFQGMGMGGGLTPQRRGGGGGAIPVLPTDGLVADWRFSEGSGTTVADETGTYPINLLEAPTPNTAWESFGLSANGGAIETPVITNAQTVAMLYRVPKNGTGFHVSGPAAANVGPVGEALASVAVRDGWSWVGQGKGVARVVARADGANAHRLVTGGWRVLFVEYGTATTGALTFGSRGNSTLNRFTGYEIAWGGVYNRLLDDAERAQIYDWCRTVASARSINLDFRDMAIQADCLPGFGQSNWDGRARISDLSAFDQARVYTNVQIIQADTTATSTEQFSALQLGVNHNAQSSTFFGPEVIWANLREDNPTGRELWIIKAAEGGTYLAPKAVSGALVGWSTEELETDPGFYGGLLKLFHQAISDAVMKGVGLDFKALTIYQGESDSTQTATADIWGTQALAFVAKLELATNITFPRVYITRIRDTAPVVPTAYATVRSAQASVVSSLGARATLVDVDGYNFGDTVHLNAAGMPPYSTFIYNDIFS